MNPSNNNGNGCTLEDCHTNLFALTDLAGIKWRKMGSDGTFCVEPLDDPVLLSFTKCIQSDILCVWRRVPHGSGAGTSSIQNIHSHKELWIFWYGDEPVHLPNLLAPELQEHERGSWDNGLTYECRTLLFKALHNLIERCLLSQNFVRIGKWFVQPYPHYNTNTCGIIDKSSHLSIRFSFFLHGESTVCASIDVREHPPLRYLHPQHLTIAAQTTVPVILAPYGLAASLTGQSYRETDHNTQKLLDEWREFYVLPNWDRVDGAPYGDNSHVAPVVEVVVAGMRMKYPSCFVMMLAEKEAELLRHQENTPVTTTCTNGPASAPVPSTPAQSGIPSVSMTSPPSPCVLTVLPGDSPTKSNPTPISGYLFAPTLEPGLDPAVSSVVGRRVAEKSWQDATITSGTNMHSRHQQTESGNTAEESTTLTWDYGEPLWKNSCVCARTRSSKSRSNSTNLNKSNPSNPSKHIKGEKGDKSERDKLRHSQNSAPFHRRVGGDAMLQQKMDSLMQRIPPTSLASLKQAQNSSVQNNGIPQLRGSSSNMDNNVESPHSAAPSPLVASQAQPNVSQNGDPTMPTLSPHPPSKNSDKDLGAGGSAQGDLHEAGARNLTVNGEMPSAMGQCGAQGLQQAAPNADAFVRSSQLVNAKLEPFSGQLPLSNEVVRADNVNTWLQSQKQKLQNSQGLKRPMLPTHGYQEDEEELVTESLYNFSSVHAFLEQPIKKCRIDHENNRARPGPQPLSMPVHKGRQRDKSPPQQPQYDPYEFSDDSSSDPGNFPNRSIRNSRDDSFARSSPFGSKQDDDYGRTGVDCLTKSSLDLSPETPGTAPGMTVGGLRREEDLKPTVNDLDNIFDTDSESSDPDPIGRMNAQVVTNHNSIDDGSLTMLGRGPNCSSGLVSNANISELTQMFPTPPSQEPTHTLSPNNMTEIPPDLDTASTKIEPTLHSIEEHIKSNILDWSFVYKPPLVCKYEGSSKYAAIELASHLDPLMTPPELQYKPSWHQFPHMPIMDKAHQPPVPQGQYPNLPSVENIRSVGPKPSEQMTSIEASPATFGPNSAQQRTPRTPMSYELQSPASNASSYMKNLNSVDNHPTNSQRPEGHSLVVNVMLSDSLLNLFKDHNFDSCSMCVCNMNIKGTDIVTYLPDKTPEDQYLCSCGFSAVVNRKYGNNSGLFYEDEVDITGVRSERLEHRKPSLASLLNQDNKDLKDKLDQREVMPHELLVLLQCHFSSLFPSCIVPRNIVSKHLKSMHPQEVISFMEIQDGCEACLTALEVGRQAADNCTSQRLDEVVLRNTQILHKWPFLQSAKTPTNSQDVVRLLKSLQPLLQDAIQKKRTTRLWESVYTILGPLTWKDFHLLAGRGAKETSGPQPIPPLLVGYDKDWLALSPYALRHWDRMMLEPYSKPRDMAYVIITPDNKYILSHVSLFFKELSCTYEACRFGRHRPFTKQFKDGILRISQNYYNKVAEEAVDDWFYNLGSSSLATKLRQYIQVCSKYLAPFLAQQTLDKSIFESPPSSRPPPQRSQASETQGQSQSHSQSSFHSQGPYSSSMTNPPFPQGSMGSMSGSQQSNPGSTGESQSSQSASAEDKDGEGQAGGKDSSQESETDSADSQMPCLVIYIIDPFTYGQDWDNMNRLATLGLFRCYQEMLKALPESLQQCTQLQIIPLQAIVDFQENTTNQYLKNVCMSVYTQSRRIMTHAIPGRSLTGFGPAAAAETVLKSKDEHQIGAVQLYSPPYILGNLKCTTPTLTDKDGAGVMMCAYCLSEDQRWLLAVCTDHNGEFLETCTINIEIPNRNRRKKASARKIGLQKLWDFLVGILSQSAKMWRLVIGRLGRLGHGELKGWACLLNKKNLQRTSSQLRHMCRQCEILSISDSPSIVSACLVSMESHPTINITPDSLVFDERPSSNCPMSTPQDASCTHILVFPTSARAQATMDTQKDAHMDPGAGLGIDLPSGLTDEDLLGGIGGMDIEGGFDDLFGIIMPDPVGSPQNTSNHGSPTRTGITGRNSPLENGFPATAGAAGYSDFQEENHALLAQTLLQQPLAMGFYVSTAKTGPLPKWFWGACPHREDVCPACFKAALHIHCPNFHQNQDEFDHSAKKHSHPLDSSLTCDVLRYVLETYNALSWLTMDSATNDRRSCLPAHFVVLMQLYHAVNSLV